MFGQNCVKLFYKHNITNIIKKYNIKSLSSYASAQVHTPTPIKYATPHIFPFHLFYYYFDLYSSVIPKNTTHFYMNNYVFSKNNYNINKMIGVQRNKNITNLIFNCNYNGDLSQISKSIKSVTFGSQFNKPVDNLPKHLTHLKFGETFNQPINNLPENLTHLQLRREFTQPVFKLPQNLTYLELGHNYNLPVDNLPRGLTYLSFGKRFNQPVDNLPPGLTYLSFGGFFDQPIDNLPDSIEKLKLSVYFDQKINKLPKNLKSLTVYKCYKDLSNLINLASKQNINVTILKAYLLSVQDVKICVFVP